jgi:hypothetical protein
MSKSLYAISSIYLRALVATLSLLGMISCTKAAFAQQSYSLQSVHTSLTVKNQFININDIAVDAQGRIYVLDSQNLKIHVSDIDGAWLYAIDLVVEDRNAGSLLLNTDGTVSVVTGRYESTRYIGTIRTYNTSGSVLNVFSLEDPDGIFTNAVRLSDGSIAAWGNKPSVSTVWIFDASLNLLRTFPLQTAPGYGVARMFAGLNGNIHYATGNGTIVEIMNTGAFVGSFTVSIPSYSHIEPTGMSPLGNGRFLLSLRQGFILEVTDNGSIVRQLLTPESNSSRYLYGFVVEGNKVLTAEYVANEVVVRVRDHTGGEINSFGRKLFGTTAGIPYLKTIGFNNDIYLSSFLMGNSSGQRITLYRTNDAFEITSSVNPDIYNADTETFTSIDFNSLPVSIDGEGRLTTFLNSGVVAEVLRFDNNGNFFDYFSITSFLRGLGDIVVYSDYSGNRYYSDGYVFGKISSSGTLACGGFQDSCR